EHRVGRAAIEGVTSIEQGGDGVRGSAVVGLPRIQQVGDTPAAGGVTREGETECVEPVGFGVVGSTPPVAVEAVDEADPLTGSTLAFDVTGRRMSPPRRNNSEQICFAAVEIVGRGVEVGFGVFVVVTDQDSFRPAVPAQICPIPATV